MAFQDLRRSHPDAMNVLSLFSFFEPESIPRFEGWYRDSEDIDTHTQTRGTARDNFSFLRGLRGLCCIGAKPSMTQGSKNQIFDAGESYSRVIEVCRDHARLEDAIGELWNFNHVRKTRKRGILWMHDITRQMARDSIDQNDYHKWLESAISILYHTFPERDHTAEDHELVDNYLPQATALIAQAQDRGIDCNKYAGLLVLCAQCYHHRAEYRKAIEWYEKAQLHYNSVFSASNPRRITLLHDLAWSYRESGAHKRAEEMFRQTLQLWSVHQGRDSPEALASLSDLAALIERSGRLKEAEKLFIELHNSQVATFGADHPIAIAGAHNLALCYANQGRMSEAEVLYRETLNISESALGKDDEGTIKTVGNLAVTLDHNGKLREAEPLYERALETYTRLWGYDHLLTLRIRSNISGLYRQQGRFRKAESMIREVLAALLETLGKSHCHIAEAMYDIAEILHDQGSLYDAGNIYKACIDMWEFEAPCHPLKFRVMDAAGILERERGELEKSRSWSERAYNENLKLLGWIDPYTLVAANNYAELLHAEGQYAEASRIYQDCLQGFKELLSDTHPHYFMVLNNLGRLSWAMAGTDALPIFSRAWQGLKILLGEDHFCTLTVQLNLARTHLASGQFQTASAHMLKIREAYMQEVEINHPRLGVVEFFLGILSASKGDPDSITAAIAHFKAAERNYMITLGASHPNYLWARCMLIRTLYSCGRAEEADIHLSNIEPHFLLDVHNGAVDSGLRKLTFRNIISMESEELNWIPLIQIPFGETMKLRWGRKTNWRIWREPDLNKLHS
jgi:tetratricopeptide (TPR) repeat protein